MACKCLLVGSIFVVTLIFVLTKYASKKSPCSCCCSKSSCQSCQSCQCPSLSLKSPAFENNAPIADKYTCNGENISPALSWGSVPEGTKSLALICDDPDAPQEKPWVHWVVYNIPATLTGLNENVPVLETLDNGICQGTTDFGKVGYGGPCPPKGHGVHHYHFKLYALKNTLSISPRATKEMVEAAIEGNIICKAELIGTYQQ